MFHTLRPPHAGLIEPFGPNFSRLDCVTWDCVASRHTATSKRDIPIESSRIESRSPSLAMDSIACGVICTLDECARRARDADGYHVSVRTLARLVRFDADDARGVLRDDTTRSRRAARVEVDGASASTSDRDSELEVDFSAVRTDEESAFDGGSALRIGARLCVIGEVRARGDDGSIELLARVVRAMDGLDEKAYATALDVRRAYLESAIAESRADD